MLVWKAPPLVGSSTVRSTAGAGVDVEAGTEVLDVTADVQLGVTAEAP